MHLKVLTLEILQVKLQVRNFVFFSQDNKTIACMHVTYVSPVAVIHAHGYP